MRKFRSALLAMIVIMAALSLSSKAYALPCFVCAECFCCTPSERCSADHTDVTSGFHQETCRSAACACRGDPTGVSCSNKVICNVLVMDTQRYSFTAEVRYEMFGLSGSWEEEVCTHSNCVNDFEAEWCSQTGGCFGRKVYTLTHKYGVENCLFPEPDKDYEALLWDLTGCYVGNYSPNCSHVEPMCTCVDD